MTDPLMRPEDFAAGFAQAVSDKPVAKANPMIVEPKQDSVVPTEMAGSISILKVSWSNRHFRLDITQNPFLSVGGDMLLAFSWSARGFVVFSGWFNHPDLGFRKALNENGSCLVFGDPDHSYFIRMLPRVWRIERTDNRKKRMKEDEIGIGFPFEEGDLERLRAKVELLKAAWS